MSQAEDLEAINRTISNAKLVTKEGAKMHDEWRRWYDSLGWFDKNLSSAVYDKGRNLRNEFFRANAVSSDAKEAAERSILDGVTTEELAGGVRRTLSTGQYADGPLITNETVILGLGLAILGGMAWSVKRAWDIIKPV